MNRLIAASKELSAIATHQVRSYIFREPFFGWQLVPVAALPEIKPIKTRSVKEIIDELFDGFLWDTPKHRRSIEVRLVRKFGHPKWKPHGWRMIDRKNNLVPCPSCGNFYEPQYLCESCYQKNLTESEVIKEAMLKKYGMDPIEHDVAIRYKGESRDDVGEAMLVEIDKERPSWFSSNLLAKTTRRPTETAVIPEPPVNKFKE